MSNRVLKASWTPELARDFQAFHLDDEYWFLDGDLTLNPGDIFNPLGTPEAKYIIISRDDIKNEYLVYSFKTEKEFIHQGGFSTELEVNIY